MLQDIHGNEIKVGLFARRVRNTTGYNSNDFLNEIAKVSNISRTNREGKPIVDLIFDYIEIGFYPDELELVNDDCV